MITKNNRILASAVAVAFFCLIISAIQPVSVFADGTETLGPPGIPIAAGTGIVAAGTGLATQPGDINFTVPAGATVEQVLLYWEGQDLNTFTGDDTITVNGSDVTGTQIGGPVFWLDNGVSTTYRADITGLFSVGPGANTLTVEGLSFTNFANGAGVLVIIDDGSSLSNIELRDGNDLAFINWPAPQDTTVAQTFTFAASSEQRTGTISMFMSAVSGTNSAGGVFRPSAIDVTVGGSTVTYDNLLDSLDGQEWDTVVLDVTIPAGETQVTVQALSVDNLGIGGLPASLTWNAAGLAIQEPLAALGDRVWEDLNENGIQDDGEPDVAGVLVELYDCGGDGLCGTGDETLIASTTTNANGFYLFADLPAGDYCVRFIAPEGYFFTIQNAGGDDALDSDADPETGFTGCVNLEPGETDLTVDAGLFQPPVGGEGCTPGYWKQRHHFDSWVSYTPSMLFNEVFENAFPGKTLLEVLKQGGGGLKALGRHTVAALLNASNPDVSYDLTTDEVIDAFNDVYPGSKGDYEELKDVFEGFNEQGCPLN
jgi:hypothetical protein